MGRASGTLLGVASTRQLETCAADIKDVLYDAAVVMDFSVLEGKRRVQKQQAVRDAGFSTTLQSKHVYPLGSPSHAVDIAPYPVKWPQKPRWIRKLMWKLVQRYVRDIARFYFLAGYIKRTSEEHGVVLRWGGDWDGDMDFSDQKWDDLPHYEIKETQDGH